LSAPIERREQILDGDIISKSSVSGVPLLFQGKVRDIYDLGDTLLLVATDRISAFDVILPTPIPDKGIVLTQLSAFWFRKTADLASNHLISIDPAEYPDPLRAQARQLSGRSMLARKARRLDVECVVRGYLAGSAWAEYRRSGAVSGIALPPGLKQASRLERPIFTPATKASTGHDQNISVEQLAQIVGSDMTRRVAEIASEVYVLAHDYALTRGLILADTKLEFGLIGDDLIVIDELLTPDSSRYWDAERYEAGRAQPSFDKQFVRDWLESVGWDKVSPPPALPPDVVERTTQKYREAYRRLVGVPLAGRTA
jgi:phosphoribosylaminoimidazole-succinocarboxamide synthase